MSEQLRLILQRALDSHGLASRIDRRLPAHVWAEAVGDGIAARARPTVLSGGVLHLLVEDHRWRDQLDAARSLIIARVNARLGRTLVRELRFGLAHEGALAERPAAEHAADQAREANAAVVTQAERLPFALREAFLRAAEASWRSARAAGR